MGTQTLFSHFPFVFHSKPKNVMVLGLASGITAGEVLHYPVERLDVIDINDQMVSASNFFIPWNNNLLSNPKTELIIQDGKAHLELTKRKYDVIISEPSNPWMAGLSILFTKDYFELAKNRLNKDGIFVQWIHAYQIDWSNFALIGRTFAQVFPNSLIVRSDPRGFGPDYVLVGFNGENGLNIDTAQRNLTYAKQSKNVTIVNHKLFYRLIVSEDLQRLFGKGPINSDNWPRLEFGAPIHMYDYNQMVPVNMASKVWISKETRDLVRTISKNVDEQIDFAAYSLSFDKPFQNMVDLSDATSSQRERFSRLMETYCADNVVTDFSFLENGELKKKLISIQIESIRKKINDVTDKAPVYEHLGNLFLQNGMPDEATTYYLDLLKINPENDIVNYNLGNILSSKGKPREAISYYREALRINPEFFQAHKNLGIILQKMGRISEGERHIQEAIRLNSESTEFNTQ